MGSEMCIRDSNNDDCGIIQMFNMERASKVLRHTFRNDQTNMFRYHAIIYLMYGRLSRIEHDRVSTKYSWFVQFFVSSTSDYLFKYERHMFRIVSCTFKVKQSLKNVPQQIKES